MTVSPPGQVPMRLVGRALLVAGAAALVLVWACRSSEKGGPTAMPSPSNSPSPSHQVKIWGPSNAHPGDTMTYLFDYDLDDSFAVLTLTWASNGDVTYRDSALMAGYGGLFAKKEYERWGTVWWVVEGRRGALKLELDVSEAASEGSMFVACNEPGATDRFCGNTGTRIIVGTPTPVVTPEIVP